MDYCANSDEQISTMLETLGLDSIEALFSDIDASLLLPHVACDDGLSELELAEKIDAIAKKNRLIESYLGAGSYAHYVPAIVSHLCSLPEFLTSYTPYQAEMSQGTLQAIFEFQSLVAELTGMDVVNASVYDGAAACAEAALMALRINTQRMKILVAGSFHPHYFAAVRQYLSHHAVQIESVPFLQNGQLDQSFIKKHCDETLCALLIQSPNFLGIMEDTAAINFLAHQAGAVTILCANPLAYGIYASAGELGVDIAVGDMQPFGMPLQCGGPYAGYMATKQQFIHQLPGRLAGQTVDRNGERGYVLTLQAREQHIRREKATSNLCTNQGICTLAASIAMSWYGKEGLPQLALTNFQRANYLKEQLKNFLYFDSEIFNEFVVCLKKPVKEALAAFQKEGIEAGLELSCFFPQLANHLLITVTELKSKKELDHYAKLAAYYF